MDKLRENLQNKQYDYMAPFLWLHGEDDALIIRELQRIYDSGIRSVCLESRTHEDFGYAEWWSDTKLIMDFCKAHDMHVWILDDKHFPSGNANNAFYREENAHLRPWGITERHIDVAGPVTDCNVMVDTWKATAEDEIVAVLALKHVPNCETYTEVLDISDGYENGLVWFDLPEGMWRIVMLIKTQGGLDDYSIHYCDMLREESVKVFVEAVYEPHYKQLKEYFGNTFLGFFSDEPSFRNNVKNGFLTETGKPFAHYPWHNKLLPMLQERLGDNARAMLAGLWYDLGEASDRFRYAYMDIISREYSRNFCTQLGTWCRNHGIQYIGHVIEDNNAHAKTTHGTAHYFRALWDQDMSGIDIVLHQLIPGLTECAHAGCVCYEHMENDFFHYYLGKLASSLAHIDPKKQGQAMCEIFGAFGWAEGTKYMKYLADHMLVRGVNYYVPHAFSPKPNDLDCPPNFYQSGENALFKYFRNIMDYMQRICHLQTGGIHVPMAAILYDAEAHWVNRNRLPLEKCAKELYDNLLDYDILPADILNQIDSNGCLNGETYPCLVVPYYEGMPETVVNAVVHCTLRKILVVKPGMIVKEQALLDTCDVVALENLATYIRANIGSDVVSDYEGIFLRHYHYIRDGIHSYFFTSEDVHNTICTDVKLSAFSGGSYILYDPMENNACVGYSEDGIIHLELLPYNSVMIFCGNIDTADLPKLESKRYGDQVLAPTVRISLRPEIEKEFTFYKESDRLVNITGRSELPNFSGNIRYQWQQEVTEPGKYLLDLGRVEEAAEVFVNGESVGVRIVPPYVFDVSALKPGRNEIAVIVSNHSGHRERDGFSQYLHFEPSGLLGPVVLKKEESTMYPILTQDIRVRDPYIVPVKETGKYYLFGTTDTDPWEGRGEGFLVYEGEDLEHWSEPKWAFRPEPDFWGTHNFWAPEVHYFNGFWYIFASFKADGVCRGTQILKSENITGPYAPITDGPVTPREWECLDGTLHVDEAGKPWIVFCHEWVQIKNGTVCAMPLSDDLREAIGEPVTLFSGSDAHWQSWEDAFVTDGPFLYRGKEGQLKMIWSSFSVGGYTVGVATSQTGSVLGPWVQQEEPAYVGGGHGMIFEDFDGNTFLSIHTPNESPMERTLLVPFEK